MKSRLWLTVPAAIAILSGCTSSGSALNPPGFSSSAHGIAVSDVNNNTILTFPLAATGSTATPTKTLGGGSTQLNQPEGFFVDSAHGHIWVGNYSSGTNGTLTEYAESATGNATPLATLGGTTTTIVGPGGIYVDSAGTIYLADYGSGNVDVFSAGSTGNVAPLRQITGVVSTPSGIWLDSSGHIWVATAESDEIYEFANNASGAATPLATITSSALDEPMGVFVDAHQNVWVASCDAGVAEFAAGSTGSGITPTVNITGASTGFGCPNGVYVSDTGTIYVADYGAAAVYVFAAGSNGNVAPIQTIPAGVSSTLAKPIGVIVY